MKISTEIPPIYQACHEKFGVNWSKGIIITYGDIAYCKYPLQPHKVVHEEVHVNQQEKMGKDWWWSQYLSDPKFRLKQEVEAYQAEGKWLKRNIKDRNLCYQAVRQIWNDLSSSIYGNICTVEEAMAYIPYS